MTELSTNQRRRFSEHLADKMLWSYRESATWSEIADALREDPEWGNSPLTHDEAELDIRNSGFLVRDIDDRWRFVHRSILEYFAAKAELRNLLRGERPRYVPTDGYRLFLNDLVARCWLESGESPLPIHSWHPSRGDEVRANQWSLLAAASTTLSRKGFVSLSGVGSIETRENTLWKNTTFSRLDLKIKSGNVNFIRCQFNKCEISISEGYASEIILSECAYLDTEIRFAEFPSWKTVFDTSSRKAIDIRVAAFDFALAVEAGAHVFVADYEWILRSSHLDIFLDCAGRLKGKILKHNFIRGAYAGELEALLPRLLQENLVIEDSSRQPHQISWSPGGRALVSKLQSDPVSAQAQISLLFYSEVSPKKFQAS
jgi:hypothetical protein